MFRLVFLLWILILAGCDKPSVAHEAILGTWKSNAELTLQSMNSVKGVTPVARRYFEGDLFGHLIVETTETESRAINPKDDYDSGFEPYEVLEVTDDYIRVRDWNELLQEFEESVMYLEGDCYYMYVTKFHFREYFCRHES